MRFVLLALLVIACGPPKHFPETRWESAPPPPKPPPPPPVAEAPPSATGPATTPRTSRSADIAKRIERRIENKLAARAYGACPTDLSMSVARTIDGRVPADTIKGQYVSQNGQPVRPEELFEPADAISRVIALEAAQPVVVPLGFRRDIVTNGKDPAFRLHMARCELAHESTTRRAGYVAAIAYLLGASEAEVMPLLRGSLFPDGTAKSCKANDECGLACDAVTKRCTSQRGRTAAMLSPGELVIEDALVRAFATQLTAEQLSNGDTENVVSMWLFGRYAKCGSAPCSIVRADVKGKTQLVYRDRRYRGEITPYD